MEGVEFLTFATDLLPNIPIIAVSGATDYIELLTYLGAVYSIPKTADCSLLKENKNPAFSA